jgi:hypothetical protein
MTLEEVEAIVRITLDFGEARVAAHDLNIKTSNDEVREFSEWLADQELPVSYAAWERRPIRARVITAPTL